MRIRNRACGLLVAFALVFPVGASEALPTGRWLTIDDDDGQPRSVVVIDERQGELHGRVENIFPRAGEDPQPLCEQCEGVRKDQPIVGMLILWGLRKRGKEYIDGQILDPANGKIYRAKLQLSADGKQLLVRGYIGFALFGRTQTWLRDN